MSEKIEARWSFSLYVNCPGCNHTVDLMDLFDNREAFLCDLISHDNDVECPECGHEFTCDFTY